MNFNWIIFSVVSVIINLVAYFVFPVYSAEITTSTGQKILKMRGTRHSTGDYAVELMDDGLQIGETVFIE